MNPEVVMMHYERDYSAQLVGSVAAAAVMAPSTKHTSNLSVITRRAFSQTNNTTTSGATAKRRRREAADPAETKAGADAEDKAADEERKKLKLRRRQAESGAPTTPMAGNCRANKESPHPRQQQLKESISATHTDCCHNTDYIYKHLSYAPAAYRAQLAEPPQEQQQLQLADCDNDAIIPTSGADHREASGTDCRPFISAHATKASGVISEQSAQEEGAVGASMNTTGPSFSRDGGDLARISSLGSAMVHEHATTDQGWCTPASLTQKSDDDDYILKCRPLNCLASSGTESATLPGPHDSGDRDDDDDDGDDENDAGAASRQVVVIRSTGERGPATRSSLARTFDSTTITTPTPLISDSSLSSREQAQDNAYFFGDGDAVDRFGSILELSSSGEQHIDSGCFCQDYSCLGLAGAKEPGQVSSCQTRKRRHSSLMCDAFEQPVWSTSARAHNINTYDGNNTDCSTSTNNNNSNSTSNFSNGYKSCSGDEFLVGQQSAVSDGMSSHSSPNGSLTSSPLSVDGEEQDFGSSGLAGQLVYYSPDAQSALVGLEGLRSHPTVSPVPGQHHGYLAAIQEVDNGQSWDGDQGEAHDTGQQCLDYDNNSQQQQQQQQQTKHVEPVMSNQYFPSENSENGTVNGGRYQRPYDHDVTPRSDTQSDSSGSGDYSLASCNRTDCGHQYQQQQRVNFSATCESNAVAHQDRAPPLQVGKSFSVSEIAAIGSISTTNTTSTIRATLIPGLGHKQSYSTGAYSYNNIMQYSCEIIQTESLPTTTTKLVARAETGHQFVEYRPIRYEQDYHAQKHLQPQQNGSQQRQQQIQQQQHHHQQYHQQQQQQQQQQDQRHQQLAGQNQYQRAGVGAYIGSMVPYYGQHQGDSQPYTLVASSDAQNLIPNQPVQQQQQHQQQQQYYQLKASLCNGDAIDQAEAQLYTTTATAIAYQGVYGQEYCSIEPIGPGEFGDKTYHLLEPQLAAYTLAQNGAEDALGQSDVNNNHHGQQQDHRQTVDSSARYYIDYHDHGTGPEPESCSPSSGQQHAMDSYEPASEQYAQPQYYQQQTIAGATYSDVQVHDTYQQQQQQQHQHQLQLVQYEPSGSAAGGAGVRYDPNEDFLKSCMQQLELTVDFPGQMGENQNEPTGESKSATSTGTKPSARSRPSRSRRRVRPVAANSAGSAQVSDGQTEPAESSPARPNDGSRATSRTGKAQAGRRNNKGRAKVDECERVESEEQQVPAAAQAVASEPLVTEAAAPLDDWLKRNHSVSQPEQRQEAPRTRVHPLGRRVSPARTMGCKLETRERLREFLEHRQSSRQAKGCPLAPQQPEVVNLVSAPPSPPLSARPQPASSDCPGAQQPHKPTNRYRTYSGVSLQRPTAEGQPAAAGKQRQPETISTRQIDVVQIGHTSDSQLESDQEAGRAVGPSACKLAAAPTDLAQSTSVSNSADNSQAQITNSTSSQTVTVGPRQAGQSGASKSSRVKRLPCFNASSVSEEGSTLAQQLAGEEGRQDKLGTGRDKTSKEKGAAALTESDKRNETQKGPKQKGANSDGNSSNSYEGIRFTRLRARSTETCQLVASIERGPRGRLGVRCSSTTSSSSPLSMLSPGSGSIDVAARPEARALNGKQGDNEQDKECVPSESDVGVQTRASKRRKQQLHRPEPTSMLASSASSSPAHNLASLSTRRSSPSPPPPPSMHQS